MAISTVQNFLKKESASGIILMFAAIFAMALANSPWSIWYDLLLDVPVVVAIGSFEIAKPLLLWINDGLMALFFFLIGLELKREFLEGDLSQPGQIMLPAIGAVGGMVVPALFYVALNYNNVLLGQENKEKASTIKNNIISKEDMIIHRILIINII